jgi:L-asparaginase / beta-aspartyl-peptidase
LICAGPGICKVPRWLRLWPIGFRHWVKLDAKLKVLPGLFRLSNHPVLVVHGGAWAIPDEFAEAHMRGVRNALAAGWRVLEKGGPALDAVEEAVVVMENDEAFDAGRGSFLNRDGKVQLDALIMDGATLRAGGVGCVEHLANPIRAARKVLSESPHVYFVAEGAERFAQEHSIALCKNEDLIIPREVERLRAFQAKAEGEPEELFAPTISHDTVGAVALDSSGNIASATSTGGTLNKAPGRLGDSSLIGCGCYADNQSAAVSTTGWGEPIMKLVLAKWAADRVASGNLPQWVADEAMNYLKERVNGHGGIILLDAAGRFGLAHNSPRMAWARQTREGAVSGVIVNS